MAVDALGTRAVPAQRMQFIDVVRGIAILGVVSYHFSWDLNLFGFMATDVTQHPLWVAYARSLAGSFMALVGVSLMLAHGDGIRWAPFWRRFLVVGTAAGAITLATYVVFPQTFIYFGILHAIALSSLLGLVFLRTPIAVSLAAIAAVWLLSQYVQSDTFNPRALAWIGFASRPASSNDYVPIFPWLALTLLGILGARLALGTRPIQRLGALESNTRTARGPRLGRTPQPSDLHPTPAAAFRDTLSSDDDQKLAYRDGRDLSLNQEGVMSMRRIAISSVVLLGLASPALATECPGLWLQINEKTQVAHLSEADNAKLAELRQEGETHHHAGEHAEAIAALNQALALLNGEGAS